MKRFIIISLLFLIYSSLIWSENLVSLDANHNKRFEELQQLLGNSYDKSACEDEAMSMVSSESINFDGDYSSISSFEKSANSNCDEDIAVNDSRMFVFPLEAKPLDIDGANTKTKGQHLNASIVTKPERIANTTTEKPTTQSSNSEVLKLNKVDSGQENFRAYLLKPKTNISNNNYKMENMLKAQKKQKAIKPGVPSRPVFIIKGLTTEPSLLLVNNTTTMRPIMNTTAKAKATKVKQNDVKGGKKVAYTRESQPSSPNQTTKATTPIPTTTTTTVRPATNNTDSDSSAANVYERTIKPKSSLSTYDDYQETVKSKRKVDPDAKNCNNNKKYVRNYLEPITFENDVKDPHYVPPHGENIFFDNRNIIPKRKIKETPITITMNSIIPQDPLDCKDRKDCKKSSKTNSKLIYFSDFDKNMISKKNNGKLNEFPVKKSLDLRGDFNSKEGFDYDDIMKKSNVQANSDIMKLPNMWLDSDVTKGLDFGKNFDFTKNNNDLRKIFDIWNNCDLKKLFDLKKKPPYKTNSNTRKDLDIWNMSDKRKDNDFRNKFDYGKNVDYRKDLDFIQDTDLYKENDLKEDEDFSRDPDFNQETDYRKDSDFKKSKLHKSNMFGNNENVDNYDDTDNNDDYSYNSDYSNEDCGDTTEFT